MLPHPACTAIEAIDLTPVCMRLMHPEAGPGWSDERTRRAERDYREFLFVASQFPDQAPRPSTDVDDFWHFHILDTIKYAKDCAQSFGYFLHHGPDPLPVTLRDWRATLSASRVTVPVGPVGPVGPVATGGKAANMDAWCSIVQAEHTNVHGSLARAENASVYCSLAQPTDEPVLSARRAQTAPEVLL